MKKRTLLALAVAMSVTAVAAANPFSDVPAKHWAYDSVTKLEKAGIVEGYGDATYRGDRTMTRYEMAQIIARAMANSEKADAALKAELDKLSVEFAKELKNLGVRVTALENQTQNVKFSGDFRLRYDHAEDGAFGGETNKQRARLRLQAEGKVNDNWTVVGRFEAVDDLRSTEGKGARSDVKMDKMFAKGQYGDFGIRLGRIDVLPAYGIFYDDYMDAAEITWSNDKFYGALRYGQFDHKDDRATLDMSEHYDTYMAEVGFLNVVKGLNVRGMYAYVDGKGNDGNGRSGGVWEAGLDYTFGDSGFKITGAAADTVSDLSEKGNDDTIWFAEVGYKGAQKSVVGSWGVFGGYRDFQDNEIAAMRTTFNTNGKGWYVGGSYAPAKNVVLKAWYENMKPETSKGNQDKKDYVRAQAELFF